MSPGGCSSSRVSADASARRLTGHRIGLRQLSNQELIALDLLMQADQDPSRLPVYPKVKDLLFTLDGGKRMHRDTKYALHQVTLSRLPKLA